MPVIGLVTGRPLGTSGAACVPDAVACASSSASWESAGDVCAEITGAITERFLKLTRQSCPDSSACERWNWSISCASSSTLALRFSTVLCIMARRGGRQMISLELDLEAPSWPAFRLHARLWLRPFTIYHLRFTIHHLPPASKIQTYVHPHRKRQSGRCSSAGRRILGQPGGTHTAALSNLRLNRTSEDDRCVRAFEKGMRGSEHGSRPPR